MLGDQASSGDPRRGDRRPGASPASLEVALAHVLEAGTYISIALIATGAVLLLASGGSPVAGGGPLSFDRVGPDLVALRPAGFLWLGILGVLATPGLRVLRAGVGFARRGERGMALVALFVVLVIGLGILVGVTAG
jgi:uncharacterized membrane protein